MSNTAAAVQDYEKIQKSAVMEADEVLFKSIAQFIEQRKEVAIDMISCRGDDLYDELQKVYEYNEYVLKQLLNL